MIGPIRLACERQLWTEANLGHLEFLEATFWEETYVRFNNSNFQLLFILKKSSFHK